MIFSRKQSKTKQSKVQMGVWLLKVIYNTGRKREESFFTLQSSCPPQRLILAYQVKETRGFQPGGSNLKKIFIKTKTGQCHLQPWCHQVHKRLKFQQGEAGHSGVGRINLHSLWLRGLGSRKNKPTWERIEKKKINNWLLQGWSPGGREGETGTFYTINLNWEIL